MPVAFQARLTIRQMLPADVRNVVALHMQSFPGFFLSFLGQRFLFLLYSEILNESGNVSLLALSSEGKAVGFVVGVPDQVGLYKRLVVRRWFQFAISSVRAALLQPSITIRLLRALNYESVASAASCPALLMSIAVSPQVQGKGIGKALVKEFLAQLAARGINKVCLTTDRDNNVSVNNFYRQLGFTLARCYRTRENRWMNEYVAPTK